jgi:predicted ATP pyrophosphatase (TIGR00289 family)
LVSTKARCQGKKEELDTLEQALTEAKQTFAVDGVVTGGLASKFQQEHFQQICDKLDIRYYSPSWSVDQTRYMHDLLANNFVIMIVGVSAAGLDEKWLGRMIDSSALEELETLSKKYGFSVAFEGGEAETFVLDCPIFKKRIEVRNAKKHWDGIRGYFEILSAETINK